MPPPSAFAAAGAGIASKAASSAGAALSGGDGRPRPPAQTSEETWPNGQPRKRETFYLKDGRWPVLHGVRTTWHENGQKESEEMYRDGTLHGLATKWWTGGRMESVGEWRNGNREGEWTWWQPTGDLHSRCTYRNGHEVGRKTYWNPAGAVILEEDYDDGGHPVETRSYRDDGRLKMLGHYGRSWFTRGRKHGRWTYWDASGNVVAEGEWRYGRPWNGLCALPAPGDAGSMIGIQVFWRFKSGRKVAPVFGIDPLD
jgi:antitoxin component YwqK of YwqJK toxin-antitoxin module